MSCLNSFNCSTDDADLKRLCRSLLPAAFAPFRGTVIEASFYPYIGLTHTIRRRNSRWVIRVSDFCKGAPPAVLEAVILMLGCKIMRRRPGPEIVQAYEDFRKDPRVEEALRRRRIQRGRKRIRIGAGISHSPQDIFRDINRRYFNNQVEVAAIGWGPRPSLRRLGHYDPVHHTITLSPVLDSPEVPDYVLRYIVYHEMLHAVFEGPRRGGLSTDHPPEFRRAERAYPDYAKARVFIREFCRGTHPGAKIRRSPRHKL